MRNILEHITVEIGGAAYIAEAQDVASGTMDEKLTPNGTLIELASRIKIAGNDPSCGLYIVNNADGTALKVTMNLIENHPSRVSTVLPALLPGHTTYESSHSIHPWHALKRVASSGARGRTGCFLRQLVRFSLATGIRFHLACGVSSSNFHVVRKCLSVYIHHQSYCRSTISFASAGSRPIRFGQRVYSNIFEKPVDRVMSVIIVYIHENHLG